MTRSMPVMFCLAAAARPYARWLLIIGHEVMRDRACDRLATIGLEVTVSRTRIDLETEHAFIRCELQIDSRESKSKAAGQPNAFLRNIIGQFGGGELRRFAHLRTRIAVIDRGGCDAGGEHRGADDMDPNID